VRLATYNVRDCVGRDGRYDPQRIASLLRELDADLIALQEVTLDHTGEVVALFKSSLQMHAVDGSLFQRGVGRYGNVLLTREPTLERQLHDLSYRGREPRGCIDAVFEIAGQPIRVLSTHLGLRHRERREQLACIARHAANAQLLIGDLNLWWQRRALAPLAALGYTELPLRTFPTYPRPMAALDRILVRTPLRIRRCWRHDTPRARIASDHFPLLAEVALDG